MLKLIGVDAIVDKTYKIPTLTHVGLCKVDKSR